MSEVASSSNNGSKPHGMPPKPQQPGVTHTSFLVYPMPSIADESLLRVIFRGQLARSLFAGCGQKRFALVELRTEKFVADVVKALERGKAEAAAAAEAKMKEKGDTKKKGRGKKSDATAASSAVEDTEEWLLAAGAGSNEELTIADLFNAKPAAATAKAARYKTGEEEAAAAVMDSSLDYLNHLTWRDTRLCITVSPITVEDFYLSGGVVPVQRPKQNKDEEGEATEGGETRSKRPRERHGVEDTAVSESPAKKAKPQFGKDCCQKCGSTSHFTRMCDGSGPGDAFAAATAATQAAPASQEVVKKFPKNCCQKCGSPDHFTRNCDGLGPKPGGEVATTAAPVQTVPQRQQQQQRSPVPHAKPQFSKDCCQKCGSTSHFTRMCDGSGETAAASPAIDSTTTTTVVAPSPSKPRTADVPAPAACKAPAQQQQRPTFARTSKDQCKLCGSESHLSRHCPRK